MSPKFKAALIRAARTGAQAFAAVIVAKWVAGPPSLSSFYDTFVASADFAGGTAVLAALGALGMNVRRPITPEQV